MSIKKNLKAVLIHLYNDIYSSMNGTYIYLKENIKKYFRKKIYFTLSKKKESRPKHIGNYKEHVMFILCYIIQAYLAKEKTENGR